MAARMYNPRKRGSRMVASAAVAESFGAGYFHMGGLPPPKLRHYDERDLRWYVEEGDDLVQRSPLGGQLEAMRLELGPALRTQSEQPWESGWEYGLASKPLSRAAMIWRRLRRADEVFPQAGVALCTWCHPIVMVCEGIADRDDDEETSAKVRRGRRVSGGRLAALYPLVPGVDDELRIDVVNKAFCHWPRRPLISIDGMTPAEAIRRLANDRRKASEPDEVAAWSRVHARAESILRSAIEAWEETRP